MTTSVTAMATCTGSAAAAARLLCALAWRAESTPPLPLLALTMGGAPRAYAGGSGGMGITVLLWHWPQLKPVQLSTRCGDSP